MQSNTVVWPAAEGAGVPGLVADARVARVLGDTVRLDAAATAILAQEPDGADGPYYKGIAQEVRGELDAALASYRLAFSRLSLEPQPEPLSELSLLIKSLEQRTKRSPEK